MNKNIQEYNRLLLQLGDIEARINFWKRYKIDPLSQAEVIYLKEIRKKLRKRI